LRDIWALRERLRDIRGQLDSLYHSNSGSTSG